MYLDLPSILVIEMRKREQDKQCMCKRNAGVRCVTIIVVEEQSMYVET